MYGYVHVYVCIYPGSEIRDMAKTGSCTNEIFETIAVLALQDGAAREPLTSVTD
jgi:hypothetical protein